MDHTLFDLLHVFQGSTLPNPLFLRALLHFFNVCCHHNESHPRHCLCHGFSPKNGESEF
ncbi:hypothetical protein AMTR_s00055p00134100 [Amborella trichopoda]|uniref:Uncharacterized protein n=1 Tax=Amborella trichopoda TaxID=13333 RepID=U5DA09_AMBTC|nr:hypothetical protein AMTR_s00055p00134100 [Amborella trichopoda]